MFNNFLQGCIHSQLAKMMHTEKYVLLSVKLPTEGILRVLFENLLLGLILKGSVQFSSVTQSCPTLCDHRDCSMPVLPVNCQFLELIQAHVLWISDAIQPSHPLPSPSPPAFNLSQHQDLFKWVSSSHQVAKVLEFQLQHQSLQRIFRTDFL